MNPIETRYDLVMNGRVSGKGERWSWSLYMNGEKHDGGDGCKSKRDAEDQLADAADGMSFRDYAARNADVQHAHSQHAVAIKRGGNGDRGMTFER